MGNRKAMERWSESMMGAYAPPRITLVRGEGCTVWDEEGKAYLDLIAGIAVSSLGHAHPAVTAAVSEQVATLAHSSNLYGNRPSVALAERLLDRFGDRGRSGKVFFCNSGAEANEAALKIALRMGRTKVVATSGSFHGRTLGALSLTGQEAKRRGFGAPPTEVVFVPFGDVDALAAAVDETTAAVILEPIQGEIGVCVPPAGYVRTARAVTDRAGALLVVDEVQTGIGRTGSWFAHQWERVDPDVVTLAKGLGGGLPIGACVAFGAAAQLLQPGDHGSTFGGNPVAAAAAGAVLDTLAAERIVPQVAARGRWLQRALSAAHPAIQEVRGRGLLVGIVLRDPVAPVVQEVAEQRGFLVNACGNDVVRLAPPLVVAERELGTFVEALPEILDGVLGSSSSTERGTPDQAMTKGTR